MCIRSSYLHYNPLTLNKAENFSQISTFFGKILTFLVNRNAQIIPFQPILRVDLYTYRKNNTPKEII